MKKQEGFSEVSCADIGIGHKPSEALRPRWGQADPLENFFGPGVLMVHKERSGPVEEDIFSGPGFSGLSQMEKIL